MRAGRRIPSWLVGALASAAILIGLMGIQRLRSAWPFTEAPATGTSRTPVGTAPSSAPTGPSRVSVALDASRAQTVGIRLGPAAREVVSGQVRAVATVVPDETLVSHVHTRVPGWIEQLYVNSTGQSVRAGQPLARIFSQELLASQGEYLAARQSVANGPPSAVVEGARSRLRVLGMTDAEIRAIEASGEPRRLTTVAAPRSGIVVHRAVAVGTAVDPSTELLTIADLSRVWVLAEVSEADIPSVSKGQVAELDFSASGQPPLEAKVEFIYPTLTERTRTLRVRFIVPNPDGKLRPGLYGSATFRGAERAALVVARDAIVDTGESQHVFIAEHPGHFVPRPVKLGARLGDKVEVLEGLAEGEQVVTSGVFLIDSESRLRASGGGGTGHAHGGGQEAEKPAASPGEPADGGAHEAGHSPSLAPHEGH